MLPPSYASEAGHSNVRLQDCQGSQLKTVGSQEATLIAHDSNTGEEIGVRHHFVVGNAINRILSLGELCKSGWTIEQSGPNPMLASPDQQARIPVVFQRHSFVKEASVCRVFEVTCEVRAAIRLSPTHVSDMPHGSWHVSNNRLQDNYESENCGPMKAGKLWM